ncbi:hypothetical protein [Arthrobacter sp. NicSoilB8]|uniref:hypothetical protein n=1 Tax=Arthrobacter sp. NicSoilB8 TaxID=2830998 RepID=UPI001CC613C0|nr:hypothetical protein [Arthrobacter sp. NicSoilB8]BCW71876.1 hypothetical protein NicSoilB8_29200 [Arthrobacter sp. NicSoilB8]
MVDFFRDMSHGSLDLNGSKVFPPNGGWYTLPHPRSDYKGVNTVVGDYLVGRAALEIWARKAAAAAGDDLKAFFNIVVVADPPADLFGCSLGVFTGDYRYSSNGMTRLSPSFLARDMSRAYGLEYSRSEGCQEDKKDQSDIMSTANAYMAPHPVFTEAVGRRPIFRIGPGLNAATMSAMSWLDNTRVWSSGSSGSSRHNTVQLRPLHRRDLPGFLCAKVGDLFVEFRMDEGWDAGLPQPLVLVHDFYNGHSYLISGLRAGEAYSQGDVSSAPTLVHDAGVRITVTAIDPQERTATLLIETWAAHQTLMASPGILIGGAANDGGGLFILNGKVGVVPPRSPLLRLLEHVSQVQSSETVTHSVARNLIQQQAYTAIAELATAEAARASAIQEPSMNVLPEWDEPPAPEGETKAGD